MYTIYKATNKLNGHSYIGFDSNFPQRKSAHKCAMTKGSKLAFHNALRVYGWESFDWEIIEQSDDKLKLLNEKETYWIKHFNSHISTGQGYNMTYGGEATFGWNPSDETKRKISEAKKGKSSWNKGKSSPWTSRRNKESLGEPKISSRKSYKLTAPNGAIFVIQGIVKFCTENKLHAGNMVSVSKGNLKHYKGWKCELLNKTTH